MHFEFYYGFIQAVLNAIVTLANPWSAIATRMKFNPFIDILKYNKGVTYKFRSHAFACANVNK